jgi:hypothetical protein
MTDQAGVSSHIALSDSGVTYHQPNGEARMVRWDELIAVLIETTDQGPFVEDVWWILIDHSGHCIIPQDVGGEPLLLRLQALPGFDNDAVIAAMSSVENKLLVCWQRP